MADEVHNLNGRSHIVDWTRVVIVVSQPREVLSPGGGTMLAPGGGTKLILDTGAVIYSDLPYDYACEELARSVQYRRAKAVR